VTPEPTPAGPDPAALSGDTAPISPDAPTIPPSPSAAVPPAAPPRFSILVTALFSLVVAAYIVGWPVVLPLLEGRGAPLEMLDEPGRALRRLVEREMDLREALRGAPAWEWWLYTGGSSPAEAIREARDWYEELLDVEDSPWTRLEHAILLGESAGRGAVDEALQQWTASTETDERLVAWVQAAYAGAPPPPREARDLVGDIREGLGPSWFADVLVLRVSQRLRDADTAQEAHAAMARRGAQVAARLRLLVSSGVALIALGAVAGAVRLRRRSAPIVGAAPLPPTWTAADGWALFVRGTGAPQAITLAFFYVVRRETPLDPAVGMAADLAMLAWVWTYLRRRQLTLARTFGLVGRRGSAPRLVGVTLILVALTLAADILVDLAAPGLGIRGHWSDGFPEDLLWTPPWRVAIDSFDAIVWAPVVEELTFRGLLYGTVRRGLGVWPAAVVSALVFVLPHQYGVAGSLSVFWSGILWAVAYERTRSLWPGILAHSANNAISTLWALATLRW
jgi:membrane protease YdiL (CAAX protease family)